MINSLLIFANLLNAHLYKFLGIHWKSRESKRFYSLYLTEVTILINLVFKCCHSFLYILLVPFSEIRRNRTINNLSILIYKLFICIFTTIRINRSFDCLNIFMMLIQKFYFKAIFSFKY